VCAKIVKVHYKDETGKLFDGLTAMVKMPSGYDSTNGDWWYAIYDDMGSKAKKQGRLFGDTHLHTSWSADAGMVGGTLGNLL
jgi:hypothetical protein